MKLLGKALLLAATMAAITPASWGQTLFYAAHLDGPSESPPNASPGTGYARVTIDTLLHTMRVQVNFSGLTGTTTASHIHAPTALPGTGTAGVATATPTFPGFPLGVTAGSYDSTFNTLDAATYRAAFVTANGGTAAGAETALFQALHDGTSYLNIHTSTFGGGEIRGFLVSAPEPGSVALLAVGLAGMGALVRRRARR